MRKNVYFNPINTLSEALLVRKIRNECRTYLTNDTKYISIPQQIYWYFTYFKRATHRGKYRIFIAKKDKRLSIGYGALDLIDGKLYITECVFPEFRGQGYGEAILKKLIVIAKLEKLPLIAEIRATNKISIALHTKCGFTLSTTMIKSGFKLCVYNRW